MDNEVIVKENKTNQNEIANDIKKNNLPPFNFFGIGAALGVSAGVGMALFLFALNFFGAEESIGLKFIKYLILAGFLAFGLSGYKNQLGEYFKFKKGITYGLFIAFISALSLVFLNLLAFGFSDQIAFEKFQLEPNTFGQTALISGAIFFEVLVYGMIITFIILQYLKTKQMPG